MGEVGGTVVWDSGRKEEEKLTLAQLFPPKCNSYCAADGSWWMRGDGEARAALEEREGGGEAGP